MDSLSAAKIFSAGEIIMTQGDVGHCAYFIQDGKVEIIVEKTTGELLC
jgi:diguanylate cyclase